MTQAFRVFMRTRSVRCCLMLTFVVASCIDGASVNGEEKKLTAEEVEFFEAKIRPILVEHCYECHSTNAEDVEGGLVLDSRWGWERARSCSDRSPWR